MKLSDQQRTEFGLFPKDWSITTIQSLLDDRSIIGHLDGNHGEMYPRADEFKEDGVPYITANDLNGAHVDFSRCKFLARDRASKFKKGIAKNGDVLFAHNATVGPTGLLTTDLDIVILSTTTTYYRCNPEKLNNRFLLYLLQAPMFVKQYRAVMAQSTRYQVPITTQRKLSVFLPVSRSEQEAIATALSDADALIESLEKLIAKKRLIKKGVMQGLLTSDETWRATNLLELCDGRKELFDDGDWIEAEHITNEGVRLIQTGNIGVGYFIDREEKKYIFETSFQKLKCKQLQAGDLLICRLADPAGRACILPELSENKVITSVDVTICRPSHKKADRRFLVQMFSTNEWLQAISERSGGTTHKRIARGALSQIEIKLPDVTTQARVADILSDMDTDISVLGQKLAKARLIKQGMMQELLTGRIRLI